LSQQSPTAERVAENEEKLRRATSYLGTPGATQTETNAGTAGLNASRPANNIAVPPTPQGAQTVVQPPGGVKPPSVTNNYFGGGVTSAGVSSSASTSASGSSSSEPQSNAVAPEGGESTVADNRGVRPLADPKNNGGKTKSRDRDNVAYGTATNAGTSNGGYTYAQPTPTSVTQTETKALVFDKYGNLVPAAPVAGTQRKIASEEDPPRLDLTTPGSDPSVAKLSEQIAESPVILPQNKEANKTGTDATQPVPTLSEIDRFLAGLSLTSDSQPLNNNESRSGRGLLGEISSLGKKKPKSNNTPSLVTQAAASSAKPVGFFDGLKQAWTKLWN
jgi:hypothetical protein